MKKRIALFLSILMVVGPMTASASATPPPEPVSAPVAYPLADSATCEPPLMSAARYVADPVPDEASAASFVACQPAITLSYPGGSYIIANGYLLELKSSGEVRVVSDWLIDYVVSSRAFSLYYIKDGALRVAYLATDGNLYDGAYTSNDTVVGAYVDGTYIVAYKANGAALWYQMGILNPPRK